MKTNSIILGLALFNLFSCSGSGGNDNSNNQQNNGSTTSPTPTPVIAQDSTRVNNTTSNSFSSHVANLTDVEKIRQFNIGDDFFENPWVEKTSSTELRDGLGPLFNNNACQNCHIRDGRGHAPGDTGSASENDFSTILFKAAKSDISEQQRTDMMVGRLANVGDTNVGGQLQQRSIFNIQNEVNLAVSYTYHNITFEDGFSVELRKPEWQFESTYASSGYDFNSDTIFSARVTQPMIGLGLLALIDEDIIRSQQDIADSDNNGISGKANTVWDAVNQQTKLGRFGWKAGQPSVRQQAAAAFNNDMGLTTEIFLQEGCISHQVDCLNSPNGNGDSMSDYPYEVATSVLDNIEFYASHLAVPQRRNPNAQSVQAGEQLFNNAGCNACHVKSYTTVEHVDFPQLANQAIEPFTDLLLHDMGDDLADFSHTSIGNQTAPKQTAIEFQATAHEWRTPPLWGLGLVKTVNPNASFLHDGRARNILEAVLWHGGEAESAKNMVLRFNQVQREQLLEFLNDL
ncbi:di-heme oxidoredictase family protein [Agarilytica rhodophyticola]|uniref:di-heme oxidoreductase family protein n=1 Tax=Agarilytica rhodophyticola TaxID=1737490 RepID=UPI000B34822E|nr:di-heme oxidoredictase family protein [Agarilytica rhodophyticola]